MALSRAIGSEPSTQIGPPTSPRCTCAPASVEVGRRGTGEIAIHKDAASPAPTRNDSQRSVQSEGRAEDPVQYPSDGERPPHPKRSQ